MLSDGASTLPPVTFKSRILGDLMKTNFEQSEDMVTRLSDFLFEYLADSVILYMKTLNYHWNVEDPRFFSLHSLFEKQYETLQENNDEIAERMRALGARVPASLNAFLKAGSIDEAEENLSGQQMIEDLALSHEKIILFVRRLIETFDNAGDQGSVDMLSGMLRFHEKSAWMLRSHMV